MWPVLIHKRHAKVEHASVANMMYKFSVVGDGGRSKGTLRMSQIDKRNRGAEDVCKHDFMAPYNTWSELPSDRYDLYIPKFGTFVPRREGKFVINGELKVRVKKNVASPYLVWDESVGDAYPSQYREMGIVMGPMLKFGGQKNIPGASVHEWKVTALMVCETRKWGRAPPLMSIEWKDGDWDTIQARLLHADFGYSFFEFNLSTPQSRKRERWASYHVMADDGETIGPLLRFLVPQEGSFTRHIFWSCNGYLTRNMLAKAGGHLSGMWKKLLQREQAHFQICGGDFLYMDGYIAPPNDVGDLDDKEIHGIWSSCEELVNWKSEHFQRNGKYDPETQDTLNQPLSRNLSRCISVKSLQSYISHTTQAHFWLAMATMPCISSWDDHECFDGAGSLGPLNDAPMVQGVRAICGMWYHLLLHHIPPEKPQQARRFYRVDGGRTLLWTPDTRGKRSMTQIISPEGYAALETRLEATSASWIVAVLPISPVYPEDITVECAGIKLLQHVHGILPAAAGVFADDAEDEMADRWTHPNHKVERDYMMELLFRWMSHRSRRDPRNVIIVSGDVHHALVLESTWDVERDVEESERMVIPCIISSPIGNAPIEHSKVWTDNTVQSIVAMVEHTSPFPTKNVTKALSELMGMGGSKTDTIHKRNYCCLTRVNDAMHVRIQVEGESPNVEHKSLMYTCG